MNDFWKAVLAMGLYPNNTKLQALLKWNVSVILRSGPYRAITQQSKKKFNDIPKENVSEGNLNVFKGFPKEREERREQRQF